MNITAEQKMQIDVMLIQMDDECIAKGQPPLSALVIHDDGAVSSAFLATAKKHNLRCADETDIQLIERIRDEAFKFHKKK